MRRLFPLLAGGMLLLSACNFSLAGDVTPPPGALISNQAAAEPIAPPAATPDVANGAQVFAQHCAACHGSTGLGDGAQAGQLPIAPAALANADTARNASPEDWYQIVTNGRMARFMPPFEQALTDQERWDALAFAFSLGSDAEELALGAEVYAAHQDEVDSLLGGNLLAAKLGVFSSLGLSSQESYALTAYLQGAGLGLATESGAAEAAAAASPTAAASPAGEAGTISGQVTYGSAGDVPAGLEVSLAGFDHTEQVLTQTAAVAADGSYVFQDIPIVEGRIFFVEVGYAGLRYFSDFVTTEAGQDSLDLPVTIYDATHDTSQLVIESHQLVFDFSTEGNARIVERVAMTNLGDKAVAPGEGGDPLLHYTLPQTASNLAFQDGTLGDRYLPEEGGFGDLRAVLPGQDTYELVYAYTLPYTNFLNYQISIDWPTRSLVVLLPDNSLELVSDDFQLAGTQAVQDTTYRVYSADGGFEAGTAATLEVSGRHPLGGGLSSLAQNDGLLIGLGALTLAVGVAWLWARRAKAQTKDTIMDEILALDARYEAGDVGEATYQKRRAALKARLRKFLPTGDDD